MISMKEVENLPVEIIALSELKDKNEKFKTDESSEQFPMMSDTAFKVHKESIKNTGQSVPIIIHFSNIVDGRNRCKASNELGIQEVEVRRLPRNCTLEERMKLAREIENSRRHETPTQIACNAAKEFFRLKKLGKKKVTEEMILNNSSASSTNFRHAKWLCEKQPMVFERLFNGEKVQLDDRKTYSLTTVATFYKNREKAMNELLKEDAEYEALAIEKLDKEYDEDETVDGNGKMKAYESIDTMINAMITNFDITIEEYLKYKYGQMMRNKESINTDQSNKQSFGRITAKEPNAKAPSVAKLIEENKSSSS